jgi:hypothetical protein
MDVPVALLEARRAQVQVVQQRGTVLSWDPLLGECGQPGLGLGDEVLHRFMRLVRVGALEAAKVGVQAVQDVLDLRSTLHEHPKAMDESNAKRQPKPPARWSKRCAETIRHLGKWMGQQGRNVLGEFLQGAAYKLGSGAVTLLILWWETRH